MIRAFCPHCGNPLRVVEEVFITWHVVHTDGGWVLSPAPEFECGSCCACGEFVDASGEEAPPPMAGGE